MNPFRALRAIAHSHLDAAHRGATQRLVTPVGDEPLRGKELHVRFEGIVPTDPYANVRVCVATTSHFNPGHGLTIASRQAVLERESEALCRTFLQRAEKLRATLSDDAPVHSTSMRNRLPGGRN